MRRKRKGTGRRAAKPRRHIRRIRRIRRVRRAGPTRHRRIRRARVPRKTGKPAAATPAPANPPADTSTSLQAAAAAAVSIFKLMPVEPDADALARRCERVVAILLPDFPELGEAVGMSPVLPAAPAVSAIEEKDDPFADATAFGTGLGDAPPAFDPLPAPGGPSLTLAWEDDPAREELARFEDGTLLISRLHPAYLRAREAGALDWHLGLCLAWALSGFVMPESARDFIGRFILRWADAS